MWKALLIVMVMTGDALAADKCELPQPIDCLRKGLLLLEGQPPDPAGAVPWVAKACASKLPDGCAQLGFMHMSGIGGKQDYAQAYAFSKQGCDLGSGLGCMNAAVLTRDGNGTKKDLGAAVALFEKSCANDYAEGCEIVGWVYFNGDSGKKKDTAKAVAAFDKSCKLGNGNICNQLGVSYLKGEAGLTADRAKALALFTLGCKAQNSDACDNQKLVESEPAAAGRVEATLAARSGKRVSIKVAGAAPPVGTVGDVSKFVEQSGFSMWLGIGRAKVVKASGATVELEVLEEKSEVVIDGKKVDHWTAGSKLTFEWQ